MTDRETHRKRGGHPGSLPRNGIDVYFKTRADIRLVERAARKSVHRTRTAYIRAVVLEQARKDLGLAKTEEPVR
jgi:hypothetical protein